MSYNLDLPKLVESLEKQILEKKDFVIPSSSMSMQDSKLIITNNKGVDSSLFKLLKDTGISFSEEDIEKIKLELLEVAHEQVADKLQIPRLYYEKMLDEHHTLLDHNITYWLQKAKKNFLLRTFIDPQTNKGVLRAFLGDKFLLLDNYDVLMTALQAIQETGYKLDIDGSITDKRMYVRFVAPDIEIQAPELLKTYRTPGKQTDNNGDSGILSGFVISNSEVGHGLFSISPRCVIRACSNGMVFKDDRFSKVHLGKKMGEMEVIKWSEETKQKNLELIMCQVKDAVKTFLSPEFLGKKIAKLTAEGTKALDMPNDCVANVCSSLLLSEEKKNCILNYFIGSGQPTAFGVSQAITYFAHKDADPDERWELEHAAVDVVGSIASYDKPHISKKKPTQPTNQLNIALN